MHSHLRDFLSLIYVKFCDSHKRDVRHLAIADPRWSITHEDPPDQKSAADLGDRRDSKQ